MTLNRSAIAHRSQPRFRQHLAMGSSLAALTLAALLPAQPACAQTAIQGVGTPVVPGSVTITQNPNQDTIFVISPQAIIDWRPNDTAGAGTIDFLPQNRSALFIGQSDFVVLNRINPVDATGLPVSRLVAINGQVQSNILSAQGGAVWFSTPGGFLLGPTANFNVGSLLLTSGVVGTSGGLFGPGGEIRIAGTPASGGVTVAGGARINALYSLTASNAYVAMVAPRVEQAGQITVDGAVALVAAEVADITVNNGLFDIQVTVGTGDANGIVHTGSTTGPSDFSATRESRAYMVAIPKNTAIEMLIGGRVGFATALQATVANDGGIILSAGRNIAGGLPVDAPSGGGVANLTIDDSLFLNDLTGTATGTLTAAPLNLPCTFCTFFSPNGAVVVNGDARLSGDTAVHVRAGQGRTVSTTGSLLLQAGRGPVGGAISIIADRSGSGPALNAGTITVTGLLQALATGTSTFVEGRGATGGTIDFNITDGTLTAAGVTLDTSAFAITPQNYAPGLFPPAAPGLPPIESATGGTVTASIQGSGSVQTGNFTARADGSGADSGFGVIAPVNGGFGRGGSANLTLAGNGTLSAGPTSNGRVEMTAVGRGGTGSSSSGIGIGGTASVALASATASVNTGSVGVDASGRGGGNGFYQTVSQGGAGQGGTARFASSGDFSAPTLSVIATGNGGVAGSTLPNAIPATAGAGTGGSASITLDAQNLIMTGIIADARGYGGDGVGVGGTGGSGRGGSAALTLTNGTNLQLNEAPLVDASGFGGGGDAAGGSGTGGTANLSLASIGDILNAPGAGVNADGRGGGSFSSPSGPLSPSAAGGAGTGGNASLISFGTLTTPNLIASATGTGGNAELPAADARSGTGGNANGGTALIRIDGSNQTALPIQRFVTLDVRAEGRAGNVARDNDATGDAIAGNARLAVDNGANIFVEGDLIVASDAEADSVSLGRIGAMTGGQSTVDVTNLGQLFAEQLIVRARAAAPAPAFAPVAGSARAIGGTVALNAATGGLLTANTVQVDAHAATQTATGAAGAATGGRVRLSAISNGNIAFTADRAFDASGTGGSGSTGGQGSGGRVEFAVDGGSIALPGNTDIALRGQSGISTGAVAPGAARGGTFTVDLAASTDSSIIADVISADLTAGFGFDFGFSYDGLAAAATGGDFRLTELGGTFDSISLTVNASAAGALGSAATGGTITIDHRGGDLGFGTAQLFATGTGGASRPGGSGGTGTGGTATLTWSGGFINGSSMRIDVSGNGGDGFDGITPDTTPPIAAGRGGQGLGGAIALTTSGTSDISFSPLQLIANGSGGSGGGFDSTTANAYAAEAAGSGTGGTIALNILGGNLNNTVITANAGGFGGDGGSFTFSPLIDPVVAPPGSNFPQPTSTNGGGGSGGAGLGGSATAINRGGAGTYVLQLSAIGGGGQGGSGISGGPGGAGSGGLAEYVADGIGLAGGGFALAATGIGGTGGGAGLGTASSGGSGTGGTTRLINRGADSTLDLIGAALDARGVGGTGGAGINDGRLNGGANGASGGIGGLGLGGTVELVAEQSVLTLAASQGPLMIASGATGGSGGTGATLTTTPPGGFTNGGNAGDGGLAFGGTISLRANGGTIRTQANAALTFDVTATPGAAGAVGAGFGAGGAAGTAGTPALAGGGAIQLIADDLAGTPGLIDLGAVLADASGSFAGRVILTDNSNGPGIRATTLNLIADGLPPNAPGVPAAFGLTINSRDGAIAVADRATLHTDGTVTLAFQDSGGLTLPNALNVTAGRDVSVTHGARGSAPSVAAGSVTMTSGAAISIAPGVLMTASGAMALTAATNLSFGDLTSGANLTLIAAVIDGPQSRITAGGALTSNSTGNSRFGTIAAGSGQINAGAALATDNAVIGGNLAATAGTTMLLGDVRASGAGVLVAGTGLTATRLQGGSIDASTTTGNLAVDTAFSAGTARLAAPGGAVMVNALQSAGAIEAVGRSVVVSGSGGLNFANLQATAGDARATATAGDLIVQSGLASNALLLSAPAGNLTLQQGTAAAIDLNALSAVRVAGATSASGDFSLTAGGLATIDGATTGATMVLRSADIAIGSSGRLGAVGTTNSLALINNSTTRRTFVGGAGTTAGYSLSAAEVARLYASAISLTAPRIKGQGTQAVGLTSAPDLVIDSFQLLGGAAANGNLSANGSFTLQTTGFARVIGAADFASMTTGNSVTLRGDESLEVVMGAGSVALANAGQLAGTLSLLSSDVVVATPQAISTIAGLTDTSAIDDRLGENDGILSEIGALSAGSIRIQASDGIYIQNSGDGVRFADRRGFTTGAGGLTLIAASTATRIVINGRVPDAAGTLATGRNTIPLVSIIASPAVGGPGVFDPLSTINGCLILNPGACVDLDPNSVPPLQDVVDQSPVAGGESMLFSLLIELRDLERLPNEPLIDDPVTGAGNDDLWVAPEPQQCEPGAISTDGRCP